MTPEMFAVLAGLVAIVGGALIRDRYIFKEISTGDDKLHERVNKIREEFVRRIDLDDHLVRIEKSIAGLLEEQKTTNKRIDEFMVAMASDTNDRRAHARK